MSDLEKFDGLEFFEAVKEYKVEFFSSENTKVGEEFLGYFLGGYESKSKDGNYLKICFYDLKKKKVIVFSPYYSLTSAFFDLEGNPKRTLLYKVVYEGIEKKALNRYTKFKVMFTDQREMKQEEQELAGIYLGEFLEAHGKKGNLEAIYFENNVKLMEKLTEMKSEQKLNSSFKEVDGTQKKLEQKSPFSF